MNDNILNIRLNVDAEFIPKAKYIFDIFAKILGFTPIYFTADTLEDIHIYYGTRVFDNYPVKIYRHIGTSLAFHRKAVVKDVNFVKFKGDYIPFLFSEDADIFDLTSDSINIRKDIIASAFYLFSGWEEYLKIPEDDKLAVKFKFTDILLIESYTQILRTAMMQTVLKNIFAQNDTKDSYFNVSVVFDKNASQSSKKKDGNYAEIQEIERYKKKFFKNRELNYFSLLSNDETYQNLFKDIVEKEKKFTVHNVKDIFNSNLSSPAVFLIKNSDDFIDYQNLYSTLSKQKTLYVISYYFDKNIGYRSLFSRPYQPFDFEKNQPFDLFEIPAVMLSSYITANCKMPDKLIKYNIRHFLDTTIKAQRNIFICLNILDFYYTCPKKMNIFLFIRKCFRKLKKSGMIPLKIEEIEKRIMI